jgi:hypothetical protein
MKFNLYHIDNNKQKIVVTGTTNGTFLGDTLEYKKCLPFLIAGELGWDLILTQDYVVNWNGGNAPEDVAIKTEGPDSFVFSNFGHGILTFKIPYLFELEENTFLWVKGPNNNPLSLDLYPTEGLVEADWFPSNFGIDYKILTKNKDILLKKDSAFCRLVPYPKNYIETFEPQYSTFKKNPGFFQTHIAYQQTNRFFFWSKYFLTAYMNGILGDEKVKNFVPKIKLTAPKEHSGDISKCPFHKLFKS